jgi:hypothetical protein
MSPPALYEALEAFLVLVLLIPFNLVYKLDIFEGSL